MAVTEALSINTEAEVAIPAIEQGLETPLTDEETLAFNEIIEDFDGSLSPEKKEEIQKIEFAKGNGKHELTWDTKMR